MPVEDPIPDWTNVINDTKFHGVAWVPTVLLRFVEREITHPIDPHHAKIEVVKILQQMWETSVINNSQTLEHIVNPVPGHSVASTATRCRCDSSQDAYEHTKSTGGRFHIITLITL